MRVLVISDMEGVAGISRWEQVSAGKSGYEEGRRLYTEEINATVRGAFSGGATEVVVMDCHGAGGDWSFNSLIPDALDARCEFVVQTRWTEYTAMLEQGCDVALFVGQHARAGAERGVLSHTVSSTRWRNLRFNGTLVGEVGINAALCGTWGTPVALVTGDDVVCGESSELLGPQLRTLAVKEGLGRYSARPPLPRPRAQPARGGGPRRGGRRRERPGLRPRGAVHDRGRAGVDRRRRQLPPPRRRHAHRPAHDREHGVHVVGRLAGDLPLTEVHAICPDRAVLAQQRHGDRPAA